MKLNEVFKKMVEATGVPVSDETITKILGNSALSQIDVDDAVATKLTTQLLTVEAAKNNPELKKHFYAQSLNGIDAEIERLIDEDKLPDDVKAEIKSADTTAKRLRTLTTKVKEIESKKAANPKDKEALTRQIEELNGQILKVKTDFENEKKSLMTNFERERIDFEFNTMLGSYNYALPETTPAEAKRAFGRTIVEKSLTEKGLKIVKKDGALHLETSAGTDYFENNTKVGLDDFTQKALANAKVLSTAKKQEPQPRRTDTRQPMPAHSGSGELNTDKFMEAVK